MAGLTNIISSRNASKSCESKAIRYELPTTIPYARDAIPSGLGACFLEHRFFNTFAPFKSPENK